MKIEVNSLPEVPNVCNQILREVWKSNKASIAHVSMKPGNVSLLHKHKEITEIYYILEGEGIFWLGDKDFKVDKDTLVEVPPQTPHKLKNTGTEDLKHLVISTPPFNPDEIVLLENE